MAARPRMFAGPQTGVRSAAASRLPIRQPRCRACALFARRDPGAAQPLPVGGEGGGGPTTSRGPLSDRTPTGKSCWSKCLSPCSKPGLRVGVRRTGATTRRLRNRRRGVPSEGRSLGRFTECAPSSTSASEDKPTLAPTARRRRHHRLQPRRCKAPLRRQRKRPLGAGPFRRWQSPPRPAAACALHLAAGSDTARLGRRQRRRARGGMSEGDGADFSHRQRRGYSPARCPCAQAFGRFSP